MTARGMFSFMFAALLLSPKCYQIMMFKIVLVDLLQPEV